MGKSPDEQPFLAAYKLRLASANSKTTPLKLVNDNLAKVLDDLKKKLENFTPSTSPEDPRRDDSQCYQCTFCALNFLDNNNLSEHVRYVHASNLDEKLDYKFDFCEYKSYSQKGVNIHKGSKHKEKSFLETSEDIPHNKLLSSVSCMKKEAQMK